MQVLYYQAKWLNNFVLEKRDIMKSSIKSSSINLWRSREYTTNKLKRILNIYIYTHTYIYRDPDYFSKLKLIMHQGIKFKGV